MVSVFLSKSLSFLTYHIYYMCLLCFGCFCWLGVRKSIRPVKIELFGVGVVMSVHLEHGADCLHMVQLMPLHPQTPSYLVLFKSRLILRFWYRLTQVVLEKRSLKWCSSSSRHNRICFYSDSYCFVLQFQIACMPAVTFSTIERFYLSGTGTHRQPRTTWVKNIHDNHAGRAVQIPQLQLKDTTLKTYLTKITWNEQIRPTSLSVEETICVAFERSNSPTTSPLKLIRRMLKVFSKKIDIITSSSC